MSIPIKNIYYIVLYAFDKVKNLENIALKGNEDVKDFSSVIADLFYDEVKTISNSGTYRNYNNLTEDMMAIKGRINITQSLRHGGLKKNCTYDDYNGNNILNQVVKFALRILIFSNVLTDKQKLRIKRLYFLFNDIELREFSYTDIAKIKFNKFNQNYSFAIALAGLIVLNYIPNEEDGKNQFIDILKNEETMSRLYESFLVKFYEVKTDYKTSGSKWYKWNLKPIDDSDISLVPSMETDIEIVKDDGKIIIDAKYYRNAFASRHECQKYQSTNMYQINSYLMHNKKKFSNLRGILLYPSNGYSFHNKYFSDEGYTIEFATVDLSKDWKEIEDTLLRIIE